MTIKPTQSYGWGSGDLGGDNTKRIFMTEQFLNWAAPKTDHLPDKDAALPLTTAEFWLRAFVKEVRRTAVVVKDDDKTESGCYWTGFALEELVRDFGLEDKE